MFGCPLVQWTQPRNPWEGPARTLLWVGDSGQALWLLVMSAYLQWHAPVGPFSRLVVARPAGAVCPCWRVTWVTPGGSWIHGSGLWTADRGHSFGCQQDEPSASLVTTNKTSMCIDLQMCLYSCMRLIVFCWEGSYYYYYYYLRGTRIPYLRIHAECSNRLSYQGQTFAVPCFWILTLVI